MPEPATRQDQVTVVLPSYNGLEFLPEAVASVFAQDHADWDLLVVDDGSTDASVAYIQSLDDPRVRVIQQANAGVAAARNTGIAAASGEFVALIDQDDVWNPDKLSSQLPLFADPRVGLVGSFLTYLGAGGGLAAISGVEVAGRRDELVSARLMPFAPSSMVLRASAVREIGGFDADLVRDAGPIDDLDLVARLAAHWDVQVVTRSLGQYRVHGGAGSFQHFYRMRRGTRFLQARFDAQQEGRTLTWHDFAASDRLQLRHRRLDFVAYQYRSAGLALGERRRTHAAVRLTGAALLAPVWTARRLRQQFGGSNARGVVRAL